MAGAVGASLLIVAALTVATLSALSSASVVSSPFANATNMPSAVTVYVPAVPGVATPAGSTPAEVDVSSGPTPLPQEQRCPCP
ncbi:hypothetical protein [Oryzihumus sp.]|uniref:hypothetical protein n=1 Tax=Oryzihumus sp. TaxID=1968903 RepID=UPI002ED9EC78